MVSLRGVLVGIFTGAFLAGGWWAFVDGAVFGPDVGFPMVHLLPAIGITLSMVLLNFVTVNQLVEADNAAIKVWVFFWLTLACVCIGGAVWITAREYPAGENWPGVSIIIQTVLVFFAGILFFAGKRPFYNKEYGAL
jgi:peptidoglycan biosynthesis protein MviN/MurJ (putative lipid II flippase)